MTYSVRNSTTLPGVDARGSTPTAVSASRPGTTPPADVSKFWAALARLGIASADAWVQDEDVLPASEAFFTSATAPCMPALTESDSEDSSYDSVHDDNVDSVQCTVSALSSWTESCDAEAHGMGEPALREDSILC